MTLTAEVVFPLPLEQTFLYQVPEHWESQAEVGSRVLVPLGEKRLTGFIVGLKDEAPKAAFKLKEIEEVLDAEPVFSPRILSFTRALSEHYFSSWGEVLQSSLPPSFILRTQARFALSEAGKEALSKGSLSEEEKKLAVFLGKHSYSPVHLKRKSGLSGVPSLLSRMRKKGYLQVQEIMEREVRRKETPIPRILRQLELDFFLDSHQQRIIETLTKAVGQEASFPFLLFGDDTRREVIYFALIRKILSLSGKALFLVPEIALTSVLREEFIKRHGEKVAFLHSQLTRKNREQEWRRIRNGSCDVVVGPRSALFSPLEGLKLIIVDQEQDESYYQKENPVFDARRGAWLRARQEKAVCVFGSERPSVEAFYRAQNEGVLVCLEKEKTKARVAIIDDRKERELVARPVKARIAARVKNQEPVLLFLNRRGYSSAIFCPRCDYTPRCDRCDITLAYHKREERLVCHTCNFSIPVLRVCPRCSSSLIRKRGAGVEAVEEELRRFFPKIRLAIFDSDIVKSQKEREKILERFAKGSIPILIGTQLLAHQTALPPVSFVGILFPETTLGLSDYRAAQKTFQAVSAMMEFARNDPRAEIVIQTAAPDHFSISRGAAGDYPGFYAQEIKFRELMGYPPFTHVAEIIFMGQNLRNLVQKMRDGFSRLQDGDGEVEILGPALAPVSRMRGVNRMQVTLKAAKREALDRVIREIKARFKGKKTILISE